MAIFRPTRPPRHGSEAAAAPVAASGSVLRRSVPNWGRRVLDTRVEGPAQQYFPAGRGIVLGVSMAELASHMSRVVDGDRHLIVQYWLIRLTMTGGQSSFAVLCTARQLRGGSLVSQESEIAGLGSNPAAARALYGQLVGGAALPIHL